MLGVDANWGCTLDVLISQLQEVRERYPHARLLLTAIHDLAVVEPTADGLTGTQVGWISLGNDLVAAEHDVNWYDDPEPDDG